MCSGCLTGQNYYYPMTVEAATGQRAKKADVDYHANYEIPIPCVDIKAVEVPGALHSVSATVFLCNRPGTGVETQEWPLYSLMCNGT